MLSRTAEMHFVRTRNNKMQSKRILPYLLHREERRRMAMEEAQELLRYDAENPSV